MDTSDIPGSSFRPARAADSDAVRKLTRTVYAKYVALMGREPLTMSAHQAAASRNHQVWVLEIDGNTPSPTASAISAPTSCICIKRSNELKSLDSVYLFPNGLFRVE